jgi:stage V sporulation protein SpoVS
MAKRAKGVAASDIVSDLIGRPPLNDGELSRRLRNVDREDARREIVDRLVAGGSSRQAVDLLAAALLVVGATGHEARLERIAADPSRPRRDRWTALSLVFATSPDRAGRLLATLSPADGLELTLHPAAEAVSDVLTDPAHGETIADALGALPPELRGDAFAYLEERRRRAGSPAVLAYRELLRHEDVGALRDLVLEAIVAEGGVEAATDLAELRDEAGDPAAKKAFQRALLRLGTRAIEAPLKTGSPPRTGSPYTPSPPRGEAKLGACDGAGAFVVLGCFENGDGTTSISDLCIRVHGEVRDGFALAALNEDDREDFFEKMRASGLSHFAPLSLGDAAAVVFAGVERTRRAGIDLPADVRAPILLFERARGSSPSDAAPPMAPAPPHPVTPAEARSLLALPSYDSWFLDEGDLTGAGVALPRSKRPGRAWKDGALARLDTSEVKPRLTAMLEHMARWHTLRGEADRAAVCARSAAEVAQGFAKSAVARAMLDRTVVNLSALPAAPVGIVGDPETRQRIRLEVFLDVDRPKGRDLAVLDLAEAALVALIHGVDALPGSHRPREEDLLRAAADLATLFTRWALSRRGQAPEVVAADMEKVLARFPMVTAGDRGILVARVLAALGSFVTEVCEKCRVSCLTRPRADVADAFFSPEHPGFDD